MTRAAPLPPSPRFAPLLDGYERAPGVADELFGADGRVRPVWHGFLSALAALDPDERAARFARGDQYLGDQGVYFRQYSGGPAQDRAWPLSHVPVLISAADWDTICAGLAQRADLLERVVADLYGPGDLVSGGHLPAELVGQNPHWLRPMVGVRPVAGHWLHHLAFEVGRSPDGSFLVLGDRAQAPSGAGFALENRMATMRIFTDPFPRGQVLRLSAFFAAFRTMLERMAGPGRRLAILTPGPGNDTYYEHTYIARHLGLSLLEGEDILVRDGQAMVRTVHGPEPLGALWRRIDSEFVDPLELDDRSQIGTPGLVAAVRAGRLAMVNMPGSGVIEARAFMAFLPRLAETLLGEPLRLPNIATWWCGQPFERAYVQQNAARMLIGGALDPALPFAVGGNTVAAPAPGDWPGGQAAALVGQESVALSTTPVWEDGRLVPRPMTFRVFALRGPEGWVFMPGGYARIGKGDAASALAMQAGGQVADVWVMAPAPVASDSGPALARSGTGLDRADPGILPARAADNLYWLGRYVERAEGALRLLRAWHLRLAEGALPDEPRMHHLAAHLDLRGLALTQPIPEGMQALIAAAQGAAGKVRDRVSPDALNALGDLARAGAMLTAKVSEGGDAASALSVLLRKLSGFSGLVHENMYHSPGWRFLSLGRAQERADGTLWLLGVFADDAAGAGALEIALEACDSILTHQRNFRLGPTPASVVDLLALDPANPRSVLYQIRQLRHHAGRLATEGGPRGAEAPGARLAALERTLLTLETDLSVATPADLDNARLAALRNRLAIVFDLLARRHFR